MNTPIVDFVRKYVENGTVRMHMPGHKGRGAMGCERLDITEIQGADALYEASGIIAESEKNAAVVFGTGRTLYSAGGSSQCIKAMLRLASLRYTAERGAEAGRPLILAARNVHKSFVHAAALLDLDVEWLMQEHTDSLCSCDVGPDDLRRALDSQGRLPAAVYITSPDYLGHISDIQSLARVCHQYGTMLIVDNAHGAYLRFLPCSMHPIDLGADMCCDSAHKTLPVLTGGAYLHISREADPFLAINAKDAMSIFGSTSPSYLILHSLDAFNGIAGEFRERLTRHILLVEQVKAAISGNGWQLTGSDPARITVEAPAGMTGRDLAERLRNNRIECEYADADYMVLMTSPYNTPREVTALADTLGVNDRPMVTGRGFCMRRPERVLSVREAVLAPQMLVPAKEAVGRICGAPAVSCPPAVPVAVAGEVITEETAELFFRYGIQKVSVILD